MEALTSVVTEYQAKLQQDVNSLNGRLGRGEAGDSIQAAFEAQYIALHGDVLGDDVEFPFEARDADFRRLRLRRWLRI